MACQLVHFILETVDGEEDLALFLARLWAKLRAIGKNSFAAGLELRADIDDESGTDCRVGSGIENLEGPVGFTVDSQLLQAARKQPS